MFYFVMYQSIIYKHIWIHTSNKFILNEIFIVQINSLKTKYHDINNYMYKEIYWVCVKNT